MAENYTPPKTKTPLFDRIFKPQTITLPSGNTVERPRSRLPLIALCVVLAVIWSLRMTGFDITVIIRKGGNIVAILEKLFRPKWEFFPKVVRPLLDTIKMSILGTVIGCVCALPVAVGDLVVMGHRLVHIGKLTFQLARSTVEHHQHRRRAKRPTAAFVNTNGSA